MVDSVVPTQQQFPAVPDLSTPTRGPLLDIESSIINNREQIEQWFRNQWLDTPAPFYSSVDLRNAGFKLAPVDTNLFPAGFNNLGRQFDPLCAHAIQSAAERLVPKPCGALLIAEDHTRNPHYWQNINSLLRILRLAGFKAKVGSLSPEVTKPTALEFDNAPDIIREPITREGNKLRVAEGTPCFVILNNDLSSGLPDILKNLDQAVVPPAGLGWANRRKSDHFTQYDNVTSEFSSMLGIDPWLINPLFERCGKINFQQREGEECLENTVAEMLAQIKVKYREHKVEQEPFVFVKADAGTYGMNIMMVRSAEQVTELNRKQRNKMARGKGGSAVTDVLVQEGVHSFETWGANHSVAEPVVYMIDHFVVGGFYRVHTQRGVDENLNAPGARFEPLAFSDSCITPDCELDPDASQNRFYTYGVVARLACLAAAREKHIVLKQEARQ